MKRARPGRAGIGETSHVPPCYHFSPGDHSRGFSVRTYLASHNMWGSCQLTTPQHVGVCPDHSRGFSVRTYLIPRTLSRVLFRAGGNFFSPRLPRVSAPKICICLNYFLQVIHRGSLFFAQYELFTIDSSSTVDSHSYSPFCWVGHSTPHNKPSLTVKHNLSTIERSELQRIFIATYNTEWPAGLRPQRAAFPSGWRQPPTKTSF